MKITIIQRETQRRSDWALCLGVCALLCGFAFALPDHVQASDASRAFDRLADTEVTTHNWKLARDYERQMRYELARQYYLLALAS